VDSVELKAVAVAAGDGVSAIVDASGWLYTWSKMRGSAMLGHKIGGLGVHQPTRVEALTAVPVAQASFGSAHAAAVVGIPPSL
jgi:hypothetical protein